MFAKQVSTYCKNKENANVAECKREMMVYGMDKLNKMEESHLDEMSPFQRDSDAIRKYFTLLLYEKIYPWQLKESSRVRRDTRARVLKKYLCVNH